MTAEVPLSTRVKESFAKLSSAAADLNAASDELGQYISAADEALKKLNLGIHGWIDTYRFEDANNSGRYSRHQLGYTKLNGKWGIALSVMDGNEYTDECDEETWLFNDAPRHLRVDAIDKLPELIEFLASRATDTASEIRAKKTQAEQFLAGIKEAMPKPSAGAKQVRR